MPPTLQDREHRPFPRRALFRFGAATAAATLALRSAVARAEQSASSAIVGHPSVAYVDRTGHNLAGPFLAWWLQHGGFRVLGWPITEAEWLSANDVEWIDLPQNDVPASPGGQLASESQVQFFERGALYRVKAGNDPFAVEAANLGSAVGRRLDRERLAISDADNTSAYWFSRTNRGVHPAFWRAFVDDGGAFAFGYPISGAVKRYGELTQFFERAVMRQRGGKVALDKLGSPEAIRLGISTAKTDRADDAVSYNPFLFREDLGEPAERWVEVDVPKQMVTFMAGTRVVRHALVSTGRVPGWTPDGAWPIFLRKRDERMVGGSAEGGGYYDLSDVFFTQYFTNAWHALHYAWWHDEFGTVQSHGCINMRLDDAAWAWNFCQPGTKVAIHNVAGEKPRPPL